MVDRRRLQPRIFRPFVLKLHSLARTPTMDKNENQTDQLRIAGDGWGGWASFTGFTWRGTFHSQVFVAYFAGGSDHIYRGLGDVARSVFSLWAI